MSQYDILILAAGLGKRMNSEIPKPVLPLDNKPMLFYLLDTIQSLNYPFRNLYIIVNSLHNEIIRDKCITYIRNSQSPNSLCTYNKITWIVEEQPPQGTGHSLRFAIQSINPKNITIPLLILSADVPMISKQTITNMLTMYSSTIIDKAVLLGVNVENPFGYGRIVINKHGDFITIIEEKDADLLQKKITLVNTGIYCICYSFLLNYLYKINNNNASNEYYLTDLFNILTSQKEAVMVEIFKGNNVYEICNVNTLGELKELEKTIQAFTNKLI